MSESASVTLNEEHKKKSASIPLEHFKTIAGGPLDLLARRMFLADLRNLKHGLVRLIDNAEALNFGNGQSAVDIYVHDARFYRKVAFGGDIGAAEAYMEGWWSSSDLTGLCQIIVRHTQVLRSLEGGWRRPFQFLQQLVHTLGRRNNHGGSQRNIAAHYDLSNDFFKLFLDKEMMYSAAIFPTSQSSLEDASFYKNGLICKKLDLQPEDHLLEIGTGWGGFALHAAQNYGCRVTTTTISRQQHELACQRVKDAGLEDRIEVLCKDYRDLRGHYDKLVSIEMIEAVGYEYLETYFECCGELLKDTGLMLLQGITIGDWAFKNHKESVDFIKRYIFPGSCLPSLAVISAALAKVTNMRITHLEDIGPHYVRTMQIWRQRFNERLEEVQQMGFSDGFIRMWEFYLCYCEGGFAERYISDVQLLLAKPFNRRNPVATAS